jgi:serine/threonine protein kinase
MDILVGLEYIHKSNVIHADMKLPNILMQRPSPEEKC